MERLKRIVGSVPGIFFGLVVVIAFFGIAAEGFLSLYNFSNLLAESSLLTVIALGMGLCILSGFLNISVGAVMSLSGIVTALLLRQGVDMILAILVGLLCGSLLGGICGYLIAYVEFDYWVVTYAFMGIAQSIALVLSKGNTIPGFARNFRYIGDGKILGVSVIVWISALICTAVVFASLKTKFGYNVYSLGDSYNVAVLSGVNVRRTLLAVFILSGLLAAVSGIMLASKSNSASPIGGAGYEFDAIAAVLIGGITFEGGKGRLTGTVMGAMLMRVLRNGLNMMGSSPYFQIFAIGVVVMTVILLDGLNQIRRKTNAMRRIYRHEA